MSLEGTELVNVCLLPNDSVGDRCIQLSKALKTSDTVLTLGNSKYAHMTVFMARFSEAVVSEVIARVATIAESTTRFDCEHTGYFTTPGRYFEASYARSPNLMALHGAMIDALSPVRFRPDAVHEEKYFAPYTADQRRNAAATGYDLARELYRPHITITRYAEGRVPASEPMPSAELTFATHRLCVCLADDQGSVHSKLANFTVA